MNAFDPHNSLEADELNADQLKRDVAAAVESSWPQFAADHPALAHAIDQTLLSEHVADSLADDPAFNEAYRGAIEASVGARVMGDVVRRFVDAALSRLK